mmetsp:Transcript_127352/g.224243  ORF Transcript_127352/g.224243 Transcript_127352/m.224243 type:complete len:263 (-) Transcript_127352:436-1224(-)
MEMWLLTSAARLMSSLVPALASEEPTSHSRRRRPQLQRHQQRHQASFRRLLARRRGHPPCHHLCRLAQMLPRPSAEHRRRHLFRQMLTGVPAWKCIFYLPTRTSVARERPCSQRSTLCCSTCRFSGEGWQMPSRSVTQRVRRRGRCKRLLTRRQPGQRRHKPTFLLRDADSNHCRWCFGRLHPWTPAARELAMLSATRGCCPTLRTISWVRPNTWQLQRLKTAHCWQNWLRPETMQTATPRWQRAKECSQSSSLSWKSCEGS